MDTILSLLGMLLMLGVILLLAYLFTKYFARWKLGTLGGLAKSSHMRVLEQLTLGPDMRLLVVQVDTHYLLLGLSSAGITQLQELSAEEVSLWKTNAPANGGDGVSHPSFGASFAEALRQKRK